MKHVIQSETEIRQQVISLRTTERDSVTTILRLLLEIETRQLALKWGFDSVYDYCIKELKYTRDEAHYRIQAMRAMREVPAIEDTIRSGSMSLTTAAKAQTAFSKENKRRKSKKAAPVSKAEKQAVLQSFVGKSTRESERILATQYPEVTGTNALPEKTKPLSATRTMLQLSVDKELLEKLERLKGLLAHKSFDGSWEGLLGAMADICMKKADPTRAKKAKSEASRGAVAVENVAPRKSSQCEEKSSQQFDEERLGADLSTVQKDEFFAADIHQPNNSDNLNFDFDASPFEVLEANADAKYTDQVQSGAQAHPARNSCSNTHTKPNGRSLSNKQGHKQTQREYIAKAVVAAVWVRGDSACEFTDPETGQRCSSQHGLQIDHRVPVALGGSSEIDNLRLLCGMHNRYEARRILGPLNKGQVRFSCVE